MGYFYCTSKNSLGLSTFRNIKETEDYILQEADGRLSGCYAIWDKKSEQLYSDLDSPKIFMDMQSCEKCLEALEAGRNPERNQDEYCLVDRE